MPLSIAPLEEATPQRHPLEAELDTLMRDDPAIWHFLRAGSLDGIWYWNLEKPDEEWMSPEFWRLFGIDPKTKRHDPAEWQDIIFEDDLAEAMVNFERHCADPDHPYDQTVRYRHVDGSTVWVRCRGIALRDTSGRPIRMLGAHNDLTTAKRAEEIAVLKSRALETANEELRAFAYGISHDLKAPSRTARQLIDEVLVCDRGGLTREQAELLDGARETLDRMQMLIHDLLDFSQVVEETRPVETVDLSAEVPHVLADLAGLLDRSNARVTVGDLPRISGRTTQIRMLVRHLVSNAVKYARPGVPPVVDISAVLEDKSVRLHVRDNGLGIDPAHQEKIFKIFARLHRHDEVPGSGLGLALCKRIAMNHDGDITLHSVPGEGTEFIVTLSG